MTEDDLIAWVDQASYEELLVMDWRGMKRRSRMDREIERKVAAALTDNLYEAIRDGWTYKSAKELWAEAADNRGRAGCRESRRTKCNEMKMCDEFYGENEQLAKDFYRKCRRVRVVLHLMLEEHDGG